jgi:outer membrane protein assembly factor BamB
MRAALLCLALCSCGALHRDEPLRLFGTGGSDLTKSGRGALRVEWRKELTPARRGNYRPIENAVAAIDEQHGRVYVGATSGALHALNFEGKSLYRFELHDAIESEPVVDPEADELYVGTERGELYAFTPSSGKLRWKAQSGAALRQKPVLFRDAIYILTEDDVIESRGRADGNVLWSYKRDRSEGFLVSGHSGLALTDDGVLLSGFNDGSVVALDALDGRPKWERPTSGDVPEVEPGRPRYVDVDTTPVKIGDYVYAASFGAGIYCLDANNGSVVWRAPEWTGITGLAAADDSALIVVSADKGIGRFELATRSASWLKPNERGSFGVPQIAPGAVLLGDSKGSLVALALASGDELGRIDAGHGFIARASTAGGRGYVVSNGGTLLAMRVVTTP